MTNPLVLHLSPVNNHEMRTKGSPRHAISLLALKPRGTKSSRCGQNNPQRRERV